MRSDKVVDYVIRRYYTPWWCHENSVSKDIPIKFLADVQAYYRARRIPIRYRFRGPRAHLDNRWRRPWQSDCVKRFAKTFAIYYK
jgi:hypothetical protein